MRLRLCKYFAVRKRAIEPQRLRRTRNAYESKYIVPVCPCLQLIPICRCLLRRRRLKHLRNRAARVSNLRQSWKTRRNVQHCNERREAGHERV